MIGTIASIVVMIFVAFVAGMVSVVIGMAEESRNAEAIRVIVEEYEGYTEGV